MAYDARRWCKMMMKDVMMMNKYDAGNHGQMEERQSMMNGNR